MSRIAVNRGFTLVELLVTIAIAAILLKLAVPGMQGFMESSAINKHVTTFMADLRYARSEAIRNNAKVVMCRSVNSEAATPTCTTTNPSNVWANGWLVFVDRNGNNTYQSSDTLLRVQGAFSDSGGIGPGASTIDFLRFGSTGILEVGMSSFVFNPVSLTGSRQKLVCISKQGRARVLADSTAACNSSSSDS